MRHITAAASSWRLASLTRWRISVCWVAMAAVSGELITIGQRASLSAGTAVICSLISLIMRLT